MISHVDASRFLNKTNKDGEIPIFCPMLGPCWEWKGAINSRGHGIFWFEKRLQTAHSVSYRLFVSHIPSGLEIDHLCRVRHCVNPEHLEAVTHQENMARGFYGLKTHCIYEHPYSGDNLYITPKGHRQCRLCKQKAMERYYKKHGRQK